MRIHIFLVTTCFALISCASLSVTERTSEFDCAIASSCTYYVDCKPDEKLTGGGFKANDPGVGALDVWASHPDVGKNRWRVTTMNKIGKEAKFSIYAMCSKVSY